MYQRVITTLCLLLFYSSHLANRYDTVLAETPDTQDSGMEVLVINEKKGQVVKVECGASVSDLKEAIQAKSGIPVEKQVLKISPSTSRPLQLVTDGVIKEGDVYHLEVKEPVKKIFVVSENSVMKTAVELQLSDSRVSDVLKMVQERWSLKHYRHTLTYNGQELEYNQSLSSYGVSEGTTLTWKEKTDPVITVTIRTLSNREFSLSTIRTITVEGLKTDIKAIEGIPEDQMRLIFNGKQLEDGRTLGDYNIQDDTIIHLVLRLRGGGNLMFYLHVINQTSSELIVTMAVEEGYEVMKVKREIADKTQAPVRHQHLIFKGQVMDDQETLRHYGVVKEACLYLRVRQEPETQANVCTIL